MNRVILCGRLTKDPDVRYSHGDKPIAIAVFTLAVDRKFKKDGEQNTDFINCRSFGKNAEFAEKYLRKGTKIIVEGHWQTGSFTGKDGKKYIQMNVSLTAMSSRKTKLHHMRTTMVLRSLQMQKEAISCRSQME